MTNAFKMIGLSGAFLFAVAVAMPPPAIAEEPSERVPGINSDESLSEQLDKSKGVITPPPVGDSEIETPAPDPTPGTTPVIPPPGTPGGDPSIEPK